MVVDGFIPVATRHDVPGHAAGTPQNGFSTVEGHRPTPACTPRIVQVRTLTIVKQVGSSAAGADVRLHLVVDAGRLAVVERHVQPGVGGTKLSATLTSGNTVTVTETDPNDDRWVLTSLVCTEIGANGQPQAASRASRSTWRRARWC